MSIFGSIIEKIVHAATAMTGTTPATQSAPAGSPQPASVGTTSGASPAQSPSTSATAPLQQVDVDQVLTDLAAKQGEKLNWQQSIVDLLKVLGLDSSLEARKELAKELNYPGDTADSASMNIWLHKQVVQKLVENGGKLPESLKAA